VITVTFITFNRVSTVLRVEPSKNRDHAFYFFGGVFLIAKLFVDDMMMSNLASICTHHP
jgi:hypothetical protein